MYIDSHAHITCDRLYQRIDEIIENMKKLSYCMIVCTNFTEYERALALKSKDDRFKIAFGFYPGDAKDITEEDLNKLETIAKEKKIDCLGEIGLDYYWDTSFNDLQKELFIRQIQIANANNLPIAIHMREATKDTCEILSIYAKTKILMHCYSGSVETMQELLKTGAYISFAGPLTFKNAKNAPDCVKVCPMDRILTETDSPYLTPVPYRGKENEPMYVEYVTKKICEIKEIDESILCPQIEKTFLSLFE